MRVRIALLLLVLGIAGSAVVLRAPHESGSGSDGWHEARPVYGAAGSGFFVRVNDARGMGALPDGSQLVGMAVRFRNQGGSTYRATPNDFQLIDSSNATHVPDTPVPACGPWAETSVAPGATFGPEPLCFRLTGSPAAQTTLVWQPDVAFTFLATGNRIPLAPIA
jgi:hypothetical protein